MLFPVEPPQPTGTWPELFFDEVQHRTLYLHSNKASAEVPPTHSIGWKRLREQKIEAMQGCRDCLECLVDHGAGCSLGENEASGAERFGQDGKLLGGPRQSTRDLLFVG